MFNSISKYQPQLLSVLRIVAGLLFLCHGTAKVLGFPADVPNIPAPGLSIPGLSGPLELVFGGLLVLGLFTRPTAFLASGFCAVGYWIAHSPKGVFPILNGGETIALYCFVWLYFAAAGAGPWSVDAAMAKKG